MRASERHADAAHARNLADQALDLSSELRRKHGADRLLAAAQVYATLSTR